MSDLVDRVITFNADLNPELVAIKFRKMRQDVFAFFRGTCHLFYEDWPADSPLNRTPPVWVCGDLHLQNFGIYQGDDGLTYFDMNDFDESLLAPVAWDIARCLTSLLLGFPSLSPSQRKQLSQLYLDSYTATLAKGQSRSLHTDLANSSLQNVMKNLQERSLIRLLDEYTVTSKKIRRFKPRSGKIRTLSDDAHQRAVTLLQSWTSDQPESRIYKALDVATRLSGLGSMGVERYLLLVEGQGSPNKNRLLELKQRRPPASLSYTKQHQPAWSNPAERVVVLQNRLQAVPPAPLAAIVHGNKAYTLRELYPADEKIALNAFKRPNAYKDLVGAMGRSTAYAHLRGSGRQGSSSDGELIDFAGDAAWHQVVLDYAHDYSQQVERDYKVFCDAQLGTGAL